MKKRWKKWTFHIKMFIYSITKGTTKNKRTMENKVLKGFRIKQTMWDEFKFVCDNKDTIPSKVMRRLVASYIKKNK